MDFIRGQKSIKIFNYSYFNLKTLLGIIFLILAFLLPFIFYSWLSNNLIGIGGDPILSIIDFHNKRIMWQRGIGISLFGYKDILYNNKVNSPFGIVSNLHFNYLFYDLFYYFFAYLLNLSEIFVYNYIILITFPLSFYIFYLFSYKVSSSRFTSIFSSLIFTFSTCHLSKSTKNFTLSNIQWIPLYFLLLFYFYEKSNIKTALLLSFGIFLNMSSDLHYGYFSILLFIIFVIYCIIYDLIVKRKFRKDIFINSIYALLSVIVINSPVLFAFLKGYFSPEVSPIVRTLSEVVIYSSTLEQWLLPLSHPIFGKFFKDIFNFDEKDIYLGIVALMFSIIGIIYLFSRRKKEIFYKRENSIYSPFVFFFLTVSFLFFAVISLPPILEINSIKIKNLSYYLHIIMPMVRVYKRTVSFMLVSVALFAGIGINFVISKINSKIFKYLFFLTCILLVIFDYSIKIDVQKGLNVFPIKYEMISKDKQEFGIVELYRLEYGYTNFHDNYPYYNQRFHNKKVFNSLGFFKPNLKIYDSLNNLDYLKSKVFGFWGVKYGIINYLDNMDYLNESNLSKNINLEYIETFDNSSVYRIKNYTSREKIYIPNSIVLISGDSFKLMNVLDFYEPDPKSVLLFSEESQKFDDSLMSRCSHILKPIDLNEAMSFEDKGKYSYAFTKVSNLPLNVTNEKSHAVEIRVINTGESIWLNEGQNPVKLGYKIFDSGGFLIKEGRSKLNSPCLPGEVAIFLAEIPTSILKEGTYYIQFDLLKENVFWFSDEKSLLRYRFNVNNNKKVEFFDYDYHYDSKNSISFKFEINVPVSGEYNILVSDLNRICNKVTVRVDNYSYVFNVQPLTFDLDNEQKYLVGSVKLSSGLHTLEFDNLNILTEDGERLTNTIMLYMDYYNSLGIKNGVQIKSDNNKFKIISDENRNIPIYIDLPSIYPWKIKVENKVKRANVITGNFYGTLIFLNAKQNIPIEIYY